MSYALGVECLPNEWFAHLTTPPKVQPSQAVPDVPSLVRQAQAGDVTAFNQLVITYQTLAYTVAYRILQSEDAADAVQDAFMKAFRALPTLRDGQFKAWLMRILVNTCYDRFRQRRRQATMSLDELPAAEASVYLIDDGEQPEAYAERMAVHQSIERGLRRLSLEQRVALVLCDIQGYSYAEVAAITGASLGTIKSRINRGRLRLRDFLLAHDVLPA
jgi:RNA polymerase sigma-70 factor, ECF subfamily